MQVLVPAHASAGSREDGKGTAADKGKDRQNLANLGDEDLKRLGALEAVKNAESDEDDEKGTSCGRGGRDNRRIRVRGT